MPSSDATSSNRTLERVVAILDAVEHTSVLSAANRMHLMPFAALTNRLGGALVLFLTSLLVPLLGVAG